MSALATQRRGRVRAPDRERADAAARPAGEAPTLFADVGGEPTLDELVSGAWEGLAADQGVPCPVCGAEMVAHYGAHARPLGGRCRDCETVLS